jgi:hypothetical protein
LGVFCRFSERHSDRICILSITNTPCTLFPSFIVCCIPGYKIAL